MRDHPAVPKIVMVGRPADASTHDLRAEMAEVSKETADRLEGLATQEADMVASLLDMQLHNLEASGLDPRTYSLVKIAALIALDAPPASYIAQVGFALAEGVDPDEIISVLVAVAPQVGMPRVVAAAPELMLALGLELDEASVGG
jgi:alkylhydroperoxidase/carboxymuconolactone decarboxylase family protein YurZ